MHMTGILLNTQNSIHSSLIVLSFFFIQCTYINGSPQNTFVPGLIELAEQRNVFLGGDDFKSGQTKVKSVLVDFLVSAGIKVSLLVLFELGYIQLTYGCYAP